MADREKVIRAVECRKNAHKRCGNPCERTGGCAYAAWIRDPDGTPYYPCYCDVERLCEDALALLREQEAMTWISVKDRLPTYAELKDDCVLVLLDDGSICSTGFDECIENESIFGEWRQNFDPVTLGATDSCWMPLEGVTHWMPKPKLPLEGR